MHLSVLLVCAAIALQDPLGDEVRIDAYDFSVRAPADCTAKPMVAPALVKFEKKDGLNVVLRVFDPPQAASIGVCVENLMKYFKAQCPGHRVLRDEEVLVSDRKGRLILVEWKDSVEARVVVPRGLRRFYFVESGGPAKRVDDVLAL